MLLVHKHQQLFFSGIIIFILIRSNEGQTNENVFRSSNVEIIPNIAILNATSTVNFLCINYDSDDLPLIINLSKNISKDQLEISRYKLNETAVRIRLRVINYVGIFHLLCYSKTKKKQGTRADVIVIDEPGVAKLIDQCQVYDKKYIKCIVHAPTIARAIQNDFPPDFQFKENTNIPAYKTQYEFLKNESTNEYLVFKWKPNTDGEFPNDILMSMTIKLPYFKPLSYRFKMTPIFVIKPDFILKKISKNKIEIQLASISPPAICEKSITPKTNSNINQTWTMIKSTQNAIISDDLLYKTIYQICIRCRQTSNDPFGIANCQEIKTSNRFWEIFDKYTIIAIVIISCLIPLIIIGSIYRFRRNKPVLVPVHVPVPDPDPDPEPEPDPESEELRHMVASRNDRTNDPDERTYIPLDSADLTTDPESRSQGGYQPLPQQ